jgi:hypothetical protein
MNANGTVRVGHDGGENVKRATQGIRAMRLIAILAVLGLGLTQAQATVVRPLTLESMCGTADVIVHGTVLKREAAWNEEKTRIYTVTTVQVQTAVKGAVKANDRLRIRQLGGEVDGIAQMITGNARMLEGEEVILFLDADEVKPLHYVVGMAQGKYSVDRGGPEPKVVRNLDGLAFAEVGKTGQGLRVVERANVKRDKAPTLPAFLAQIRAALRQ